MGNTAAAATADTEENVNKEPELGVEDKKMDIW